MTCSASELLSLLTFVRLTCKNWNQFVELFGEKGECGNCWCMYYRLKNTDFKEGKLDDGNRNAMKELVWQNKPNGKILHRKK